MAAQPGKPIVFRADLTIAQEVPSPGTLSAGVGAGVFLLNEDRTELAFAIAFTGLSGPLMNAHFHTGAFGVAGPVRRTICGAPPVPEVGPCPAAPALLTGTWKSTDTQPLNAERVQELLEGKIYVNLHTAANPAGEIRGQVIPVSTP